MRFKDADVIPHCPTFTSSFAWLSNEQEKAANRPMACTAVSGAEDPSFRSVRVNLDFRIIVLRRGDGMTLCHIGHHDEAYKWVQRRNLQTHPTTGAAQLVELREVIQEVATPKYVEAEHRAAPKPQLIAPIPDDQLLGYGVPVNWIVDVKAADEDSMLDVADHLPATSAEALL